MNTHVVSTSRERSGVSPAVSVLTLILLALVTWWAGPVLRHFEGALVPWPVHGVALALLLAARPRDRVWLALGIVFAVAIGASATGGNPARAVASGSQMAGQTIVIVLFYDWLTKGRHPLRGTISYAYLGTAIVIGVLPTTVLAELVRQAIGPWRVPNFTILSWFTAAVTSMAALTPLLLAPSAPHAREAAPARLVSLEFGLVVTLYVGVLLNAFFYIGQPTVALPPALAALPFLAWAGLRFGVRGYALVAALFVTVVVASTVAEVGPFLMYDEEGMARGRRAWIYVASLVGPAMIFPVALADRTIAEARARGAYAQLSAIIEGSGDLIAAVDRDFSIIAANPAWIDEYERISGIRVATGMRMEEVLRGIPQDAAGALANWRRAMAGERFTEVREVGNPDRARDEYEITYGPVRDPSGQVVGASQVVRNVTTRRKREVEEANARRLESVGRLAGGVAHDFNNLMTAVIGYSDLVKQSFELDDPRRDDVAQIERAATRAGELTQQLLAFARRRSIDPKVVDVGELVEGFTRMLGPLLGPGIQVGVRSEPELPRVRLDPAQFEQVLMNLAVNARDAMPGGGSLTIALRGTVRGDRRGVLLTVRDTGTGMSDEVLARLWEPFFTTKPQGSGTGLGLPTVHGIVHQAGGDITVESELGVGTTFVVFLPAAPERDERPPA